MDLLDVAQLFEQNKKLQGPKYENQHYISGTCYQIQSQIQI
jgi:hypothetical protein